MAEKSLEGVRVATLCAADFDQSEMTVPRKALEDAGAETAPISLTGGEPDGDPNDFDGLLMAGGTHGPEAQRLARGFEERHKPVFDMSSRQAGDSGAFNRDMIARLARHRAEVHQRPLSKTVQEYVGAEQLDSPAVEERRLKPSSS
jgi:hypothetical protein